MGSGPHRSPRSEKFQKAGTSHGGAWLGQCGLELLLLNAMAWGAPKARPPNQSTETREPHGNDLDIQRLCLRSWLRGAVRSAHQE
jgi:hypothetical protein